MGHSSPVVADHHVAAAVVEHHVVAEQSVVADQITVADQYTVTAKQLFGTLESDRKPSSQIDVPIPGRKMAVVNKSDAEAQHGRSTTKMELQEHHQDPPRWSINIRVRRNGTKVAVPITFTINLQLCRTRVPARRFALRRSKPKVSATQFKALLPQPGLEDDGQAESVLRQLQDLGSVFNPSAVSLGRRTCSA